MQNNIIYSKNKEIHADKLEILEDMILKITFSTNEVKLFDAKQLLEIPIFKVLKDNEIFKSVTIEQGAVTWGSVNLDIAPETLYKNSYYQI